MSKVTLTFEDADDGTVIIKGEFEPELVLENDTTPAESMAIRAVNHVTDSGDEDPNVRH